jgi:hypothetical protein
MKLLKENTPHNLVAISPETDLGQHKPQMPQQRCVSSKKSMEPSASDEEEDIDSDFLGSGMIDDWLLADDKVPKNLDPLVSTESG